METTRAAVVITDLIQPDPVGDARAGVEVTTQRLRYVDGDEDTFAATRTFTLSVAVRSTGDHALEGWRLDVEAFDDEGLLVMVDEFNDVRPGREPGTGNVLVNWEDDLGAPLPAAVRLAFRAAYGWPADEATDSDVDGFADLPPSPVDPKFAPPSSVVERDKYPTLGKREFARILKDPYAHFRQKFTLYCRVTQFDTATGPGAFMADAAVEDDGGSMYGGTTSWFEAREDEQFADVVEGDILRLKVSCDGEYSYTSRINAEMTIPSFRVHKLRVVRFED